VLARALAALRNSDVGTLAQLIAAATEPPEDPETLVAGVRIPRCFRMLLTPTKYMICNTAQQHTWLFKVSVAQ
jgi:hypothetical protein